MTDHESVRMLLGGYLLGGLDEPDRDLLEGHLAGCDACREELIRLGPVPELLRRPVADPPPPAGPSPERIAGLLRQMPAERGAQLRRGRWPVYALAAAIVAVTLLGAALLWPRESATFPTAGGTPTPSSQATPPVVAQFVEENDSGMAGHATFSARTWGVSVAVDVTKLSGQGPFVLRVTGASGTSEQACIWGSTPSGNAKVTGASSLQLPAVSAVAVADRQGRVLGTARL